MGWVLAGAATMIGMNEGAEIGGNMAKDLSDACKVDSNNNTKLVNMTPSQITALEHAGVKVEDAEGKLRFEFIDIIKPEPMRSPKSNIEYVDPLEEATKLPDYNKVGNIIDVYLTLERRKLYDKNVFPFSQKTIP